MTNKQLGYKGEKLAERYLISKGYEILCNNYHCEYGEVDIIAKDGEYIVFVEVKTRRSDLYGRPILAVDKKKQKRLIDIAWYYLKSKDCMNFQPRFDVIEIVKITDRYEINHVSNAFCLESGQDEIF